MKLGDVVRTKSKVGKEKGIGLIIDIEPKMYLSSGERDDSMLIHLLLADGSRASWFDWQLEIVSKVEQE